MPEPRPPRPRGGVRTAVVTVLTIMLGTLAASPVATADPVPQIHVVAGGGHCSGAATSGGPCDDVSATSASIGTPTSVAALPGGGYLYVDELSDLVREVEPSGKVITVAGNGTRVDGPDGSLAIDSGLDGPVSVSPLASGGFLITEYDDSLIRMVSPGTPQTATITTIAGTGVSANTGMGGPATTIPLDHPTDAEQLADGSVLIADSGDLGRPSGAATSATGDIRQLSAAAPGATITIIAGGGSCDDAQTVCDGMPASQVTLHHPASISPIAGGAGGYLIAEYRQDAVRMVSAVGPAGTFSTVAGVQGSAGYSGDGGPATAAQLNHPDQVVSNPDGSFLIADTGNNVIREVSPTGTISTIAGNGFAAELGDGGPATAASLDSPEAVAPTVNGGTLIADTTNGVIREVTLPPVTTITLSPATPNGGNGWYVTNPTAKVSATEGASINCELDPPVPPPAFSALISPCAFKGSGAAITGNGSHVLWAAGQNAFGDLEDPHSLTVNVDVGPPVVYCNTAPQIPFGSQNAMVTATLEDAISGPASTTISTPVYAGQLGPSTAVIFGANNAGTGASVTCDYTVVPLHLQPAPVAAWHFLGGPGYVTVDRLTLFHVPRTATVRLMCSSKTCPFRAMRAVPGKHANSDRVKLAGLLKHRHIDVGTTIAVAVTAPGTVGWAETFTINARTPASAHVECLAPGSTVPGLNC